MRLLISDNMEDCGLDVYHVTLDNFGDMAYHPFIASRRWDDVEIEVSDNTPRGFISQLVSTTVVVPIINVNTVTPKMLAVLCEIYPDSAAEFRSTFQKEGPVKLLKKIQSLTGKLVN